MTLNFSQLRKSPDFALFLGMLSGDGCLPIKHNGAKSRIYPILFYNTYKPYVNLFSELFSSLFNINGTIRCRKRDNKKPLWEFEKYSVDIYTILHEEFEMPVGKKAAVVRAPSFVLNGNEDMKKHFFLGILLTDGGIRKDNSIIFHTASKNLLIDLKKILFDLWGLNKSISSYLQKNKFRSFQINLNRAESSLILSQMPRSHNLVLRRS